MNLRNLKTAKRMYGLLLAAIGLSLCTTVKAGLSVTSIREETRFLTDKMAYELNLTTLQYNDVYEINYDFISTVCVSTVIDRWLLGEAQAREDYLDALDIRNDDLRWVLSDSQYRKFLETEYFYYPISISGGKWFFSIYTYYPNRNLFYFGLPSLYYSYAGAHYRKSIKHSSYYKNRHTTLQHYSSTVRVRDQKNVTKRAESSPRKSTVTPVTSNKQPTTSNKQPTNKQPTTSNKQPTTSNKQPTTSNKQPTTSNKQPTTSNKQPTTSNKQPTTSNKQPTTSNKQPTTSNKQPTTSNKQPTTSNKQSTTSGRTTSTPNRSSGNSSSTNTRRTTGTSTSTSGKSSSNTSSKPSGTSTQNKQSGTSQRGTTQKSGNKK